MIKPDSTSNAEILAPAGSVQALIAALRCGADAVYLGAGNFNARMNAHNFSPDELEEAVKYCHSHKAKVYLALNTLISDEEINEALELVERVCAIGIDALILQDLGLAKLIHQGAPDMAMHASTQMSVQTLSGIEQLADLGFKRVVLPRELDKKEIKYLAENSPIETELFVHGAHCMSVSGQCMMSAAFGGRSANRGQCAQPCRLDFHKDRCGEFALSLKDLSLIQHLRELNEMGISSFKIEGRMKRPEYVAAAVTACRNALNDVSDERLTEDLHAVFSRSGFTDGYYMNKCDKEMFGFRRKEDVVSAAPVLKGLEKLYQKETGKIKVDFSFFAREAEPLRLRAKTADTNIEIVDEFCPGLARTKSTQADDIEKQLSKCGGTAFLIGEIRCDIDKNLNIPLSVVNRIRRTAIERLTEFYQSSQPVSFIKPNIKLNYKSTKKSPKYFCRFRTLSQVPDDTNGIDTIILPLSELMGARNFPYLEKLHVQLPRGIFGHDEQIFNHLIKLKEAGITRAFAPTLDAISIAQKAGFDVTADIGANVFNSHTLESLAELDVKGAVLSPEMSLSAVNKTAGRVPQGVVVYGKLPLMLMRNCPLGSCKNCSKKIRDRMDIDFQFECNGGCSEILNSRPIYMADRLSEIKNADFYFMNFTTETKQETGQIIEKYKTGTKPTGEFTRGLLYRGVL